MSYDICNKCLSVKEDHMFPKVGHICKACKSLYRKQYRAKNIEKENKQKMDWCRLHSDYSSEYHIKNRDRRKEVCHNCYKKKKNEYLKRGKKYKNDNIEKTRALIAKYRSSKLNATPKWLSKEQLNEISDFYHLAQELAWLNEDCKLLQVDHIIPLQNENVCGLHVPWNLQLLHETDNNIKNNSFDFTYDNESWKSLIDN